MDTQLTVSLEAVADEAISVDKVGARALRINIIRVNLARLAMRGLTAKQAAKALNISHEQAYKHYRDPEFKRNVLGRVSEAFGASDERFAEQKLSLTELINEQAYASFFDLVALLKDPECTVSLKAKIHQDFLDRTQEGAKHSVSTQNIDASQLAIAAKVALEITSGSEMHEPRGPQTPRVGAKLEIAS